MSCGSCGSPLAPRTGDETGPPRRESQVCHVCITRISIIDGTDADRNPNLTQNEVTQFVNLPQEREFVDDVTRNIDRLGNMVGVLVEHEGSATFEYRAVPGRTNAGYSEDERTFNANYVYRPSAWNRVTGESLSRRFDRRGTEKQVQIAASGGEEFRIEARCTACGHLVSCGPVVVKRRAWYVPVAMEVSGVPVSIPNLTSFKEYFERLHLSMRELPRQSLDQLAYRSIQDRHEIVDNLRDPYEDSGASDKAPHAIAFAFMDQLATQTEHVYSNTHTLNRNPGGPPSYCDIPLTEWLWWDMPGSPDEWFIRGRFYDDASDDEVDITGTMLTPLPGNSVANRRNVLRLTVDPILDALGMGTGAVNTARGLVRLRVNVATHWTNGYYAARNYIVMATRSFWQDRADDWIIQTMRHEFGHAIMLVPTADRADCRGLDPVPTSYAFRGHQGHHCSFGVTDPLPASGKYGITHARQARCNMFGESGSQTYRNMMNYCDNCERAVKMVDMQPGWRSP